jgi:hypothetical protein
MKRGEMASGGWAATGAGRQRGKVLDEIVERAEAFFK